jgi:hypothetical protein
MRRQLIRPSSGAKTVATLMALVLCLGFGVREVLAASCAVSCHGCVICVTGCDDCWTNQSECAVFGTGENCEGGYDCL